MVQIQGGKVEAEVLSTENPWQLRTYRILGSSNRNLVGGQQVDHISAWKGDSKLCALAGTPRSQEEEALLRGLDYS
jgi:hypothetical protein